MTINNAYFAALFLILGTMLLPLGRPNETILAVCRAALRGGVLGAVAACALFHFCPDRTPAHLDWLAGPAVADVYEQWPVLRVVGRFAPPWALVALLLVVAGRITLLWLKPTPLTETTDQADRDKARHPVRG